MQSPALLTLRLHAPLAYSGLENPPLGPEALFAPCEDEELFILPDEGLVRFDESDGPRAMATLPPLAFYGVARPGKAETEGQGYDLPAGEYLFMQFRPQDQAEFLAGVEWFAREAWWEGQEVLGPWLVRRVREDGKVAHQLLRSARIKKP